VPNRHPLTEDSTDPCGPPSPGADSIRQQRPFRRDIAQLSVVSVFVNWAALIALWALPYLTLLDRLHIDAARSESLQWSLLIVGATGLGCVLYEAWSRTLDPGRHRGQGFRGPSTPAV